MGGEALVILEATLSDFGSREHSSLRYGGSRQPSPIAVLVFPGIFEKAVHASQSGEVSGASLVCLCDDGPVTFVVDRPTLTG